MEFELPESPLNKFYKVRERFRYQFKILEMKRFFRDPLVWLFASITVTIILYQIVTLKKFIDQLPSKLALMQMYISLDKKLVMRDLIYSIPILSALALLISIILSQRQYSYNKTLARLTIFYANSSTLLLTYVLVKTLSFYIY